MSNIKSLKHEIDMLRDKLENERLSPEDTQTIRDLIDERKREIEDISRKESIVINTEGATISERPKVKPSRMSSNRFML